MNQEKKKFQIQRRVKKIVSPNDKLSKTLFNLPAGEYADVIQNGRRDYVTEKIIRGKKIKTYFWLGIIGVSEGEEIPTHFKVEGIGTVNICRPLNEYDRDVFVACISAQETGFEGITVDSLFRVITGDDKKQPTPAEKTAILESIGKLLITAITIDFSEAREKMKKYDSVPKRLVGAILPCKYLDGVEVNGRKTAIIKFLDESPLITIARAKKQIISYPAALRDIPNQNNTPLVIMIKSYVIRRVEEIIQHNMTPTITFADVFNHCGLTEADKWQKQDARKVIAAIFETLKTNGKIKNFEFERDGNIYRAIKIIN